MFSKSSLICWLLALGALCAGCSDPKGCDFSMATAVRWKVTFGSCTAPFERIKTRVSGSFRGYSYVAYGAVAVLGFPTDKDTPTASFGGSGPNDPYRSLTMVLEGSRITRGAKKLIAGSRPVSTYIKNGMLQPGTYLALNGYCDSVLCEYGDCSAEMGSAASPWRFYQLKDSQSTSAGPDIDSFNYMLDKLAAVAAGMTFDAGVGDATVGDNG
jgi:hypothetical protein